MMNHLIILLSLQLCILLLIGASVRSLRPVLVALAVTYVVACIVWFVYPVWQFFVERSHAGLRLPSISVGGVFYYSHYWLPLLCGVFAGICAALLCAGKVTRQILAK